MRDIIAYKHYFIEFYHDQDQKTQRKIEFVLDLIKYERRIPKKFLKYIEGSEGIYEIRVITYSKHIRIMCFFDEDDVVVLTNCFLKKSKKTPRRILKLATALKNEYLLEKQE